MRRHIIHLTRTYTKNNCIIRLPSTRFLSTDEVIERRNHLFTLEKKRQVEKVGRIEKIEVKYKGIPNDCTLILNKDLSTPHDCARHISEWHAESSALAIIDDSVYWDMHRPLTENCTLQLQNFTVADPKQVNKAFWRTCSLVLGACATMAFKRSVPVFLHSFPHPDIRSGSFIYDVDLPSLENWQPTHQELVTLSAEYLKIVRQNLPLERLEVGEELALEMFRDNEHKSQQIPSIASANGRVILYRVGNHVDISKGPLIGNTSLIGRVAIPSVHRLEGLSNEGTKQLYRFQGVALPMGVNLNHFAFSILTDRAKKLNHAKSPLSPKISSSGLDELQESVAAKA